MTLESAGNFGERQMSISITFRVFWRRIRWRLGGCARCRKAWLPNGPIRRSFGASGPAGVDRWRTLRLVGSHHYDLRYWRYVFMQHCHRNSHKRKKRKSRETVDRADSRSNSRWKNGAERMQKGSAKTRKNKTARERLSRRLNTARRNESTFDLFKPGTRYFPPALAQFSIGLLRVFVASFWYFIPKFRKADACV